MADAVIVNFRRQFFLLKPQSFKELITNYCYKWTRVDEGRKVLSSSRDKNEGTYRSGEEGGGPGPLCDPESKTLLNWAGGSARVRSARTNKWDVEQKKEVACLSYAYVPVAEPFFMNECGRTHYY